MEGGKLSGTVGENPEPVKISLTFLNENGPGKILNCPLLLRLEGGGSMQSSTGRRLLVFCGSRSDFISIGYKNCLLSGSPF